MARDITYIIGIILLLLFLAIYIWGGGKSLLSQYANSFFRSDYNSLPQSTKSSIETQFDILVKNIQDCKNLAKQNCICKDVFPNYPNTFTDDMILKVISGKEEDKLSLFYKNNEVKTAIVNDSFIEGISVISSNNIVESKKEIEHLITFKKGQMYFDNAKILSSGIYKKPINRLGIIFYKRGFLGLGYPSENIQKSLAEKLVAC